MPRLRPLLAALLVAVSVGTLAPDRPAGATAGAAFGRMGGIDRYETSVRLSQATFSAPTPDAWIARGDLFPDALAASYSARANGGGPILLNPRDRLDARVVDELRRLQTRRVFVLGSTDAITAEVETELRDVVAEVTRVSGATRYETAVAAARTVTPDPTPLAFVASGESFADALAAGPAAYAEGIPLLLTPKDALDPATATALRDLAVEDVVIVGGTAAVTERVREQIEATCRTPSDCVRVSDRLAGEDRTHTATLVAEWWLERHRAACAASGATCDEAPVHVQLARGDDFPDAVSGAPHAGEEAEERSGMPAPVLFARSPHDLGAHTREWLRRHSSTIASVHVFGTAEAMSNLVVDDARRAVAGEVPTVTVTAVRETKPVANTGDAADDPAIWVHPTDTSASTIIGTDKQGALTVYDLSGAALHTYTGIRPNNVDIRGDVVAASNIADDSILLFRIDVATRGLRRVDARTIDAGIGLYGLCMYRSPVSGRTYVIDSDQSGTVQQWEVFEAGDGLLDARLVRSFRLSTDTEGCVVDDELRTLYVSEEAVGIWRFDAEPTGGSSGTLVDRVGQGRLVADVEGLAVYRKPGGEGYLIASSQGDDRFSIYHRRSGAPVGRVAVQAGSLDAVTHTDGIDATSTPLGDDLPDGLLVVQDDRDESGRQNFKLVSWTDVARALGLGTNGSTDGGDGTVGGAAFYVDSISGSDTNAGTSPDTAWRSLARASAAELGPGDSVLLRRGLTFVGGLTVALSGTTEAPIVIGAYGNGTRPTITGASTCVAVTGAHVRVRDIHVDDCSWAGVSVSGAHAEISGNRITRNAAGVYLKSTAMQARVVSNEIVDNNKMSVNTAGGDGDSGAFGVLVHGDANEIAHNLITGSDAFSYDYGRDGAAIEIYGGRNNSIHHNRAIDNDAFAELGNSRASGNTFAYNLVRSSLETSVFLVTRGAESSYGPVTATTLVHNTVLLTGAKSQGVICHAGCGAHILTMRNNVVQAVAKAAYADLPFDEGNDVFFGGRPQLVLGPGSVYADPLFVAAGTGDLRLQAGSPAVDRGVVSSSFLDLNGDVANVDGNDDGVAAPDAGAFEYQG